MYDSIWNFVDDDGNHRFGWHVIIHDEYFNSPITCFDEAAELLKTLAMAALIDRVVERGTPPNPNSCINYLGLVLFFEAFQESEVGLGMRFERVYDYDLNDAEVTLYGADELATIDDINQMMLELSI